MLLTWNNNNFKLFIFDSFDIAHYLRLTIKNKRRNGKTQNEAKKGCTHKKISSNIQKINMTIHGGEPESVKSFVMKVIQIENFVQQKTRKLSSLALRMRGFSRLKDSKTFTVATWKI